jgi:hypothetical protein
MKWEPADIIRLIALIGAFLLFALGAYMMWQGIAAEGAINIKSFVLTGSIKTASAGLFIAFLSFAIIVFVLLSLVKRSLTTAQPSTPSHAKSTRLAKILIGLLIGLVVSGGLASLGYGNGFGALAMFLGFMMFIVIMAYISFLENE